MELTINLKDVEDNVLFEHTAENNSVKKTLEVAVKQGVPLRFVNLQDALLHGACLHDACLHGANLENAYLQDALLQDVNLQDACLRNANLEDAYLGNANLGNANLENVNLRNANLQDACLYGASLQCANIEKRYISIGGIGSLKRKTTYCFDDDIIWCGCFKGTLKEFENKVNKTYFEYSFHYKEYMGFIKYLESLKKYRIKKNIE